MPYNTKRKRSYSSKSTKGSSKNSYQNYKKNSVSIPTTFRRDAIHSTVYSRPDADIQNVVQKITGSKGYPLKANRRYDNTTSSIRGGSATLPLFTKAGVIYNLFSPNRGSKHFQRETDFVKIFKISWTISIHIESSRLGSFLVYTYGFPCRILIFYDRQSKGSFPVHDDLGNKSELFLTGENISCLGHLNPYYRDRIIPIFDKTITLCDFVSGDSTSSDFLGPRNVGPCYDPVNNAYLIKGSFKCKSKDFTSRFYSNSVSDSGIASVQSGSLCAFFGYHPLLREETSSLPYQYEFFSQISYCSL